MNSPRQRLCFKSVAVKSSGNTSTLNVFWVMLQLLLFSVEGRQTPPVRIKARSGVHGSKEIYKNLSNRDPGPVLAAALPTSSWLAPPKSPAPPPVEPISITIIAIGALAGVIFVGAICYLFCTKWARLKKENMWLPKDASRGEILELIEQIRIGAVDADGAPLHVINWVVHGANAPWPPPDGIKSLKRRRRGHRTMAPSWINSSAVGDSSIELPQRIQPRRPREQLAIDPSISYIRKAVDIPQDYPLPPPEPAHNQASAIILSNSSKQFLNSREVEAETIMGPYTEIPLHADSEFESEVGSRRTTLREPEDLPLTALSPRPHRQGYYLSLQD